MVWGLRGELGRWDGDGMGWVGLGWVGLGRIGRGVVWCIAAFVEMGSVAERCRKRTKLREHKHGSMRR